MQYINIIIHGMLLQLVGPSASWKMVENTPDDPRKRKPDKAKTILGWEPKVLQLIFLLAMVIIKYPLIFGYLTMECTGDTTGGAAFNG